MASYVANHIRVICPSGLLCSTNSFLMNLSYNSVRKVTKRTPPRPVCPSGPRGIQLCLRAVLTRRPGSTGLNLTSVSAIFLFLWPYQSRMPRQTSRGITLLPSNSVQGAIAKRIAPTASGGLRLTSNPPQGCQLFFHRVCIFQIVQKFRKQ
jgi:hypothetical protein